MKNKASNIKKNVSVWCFLYLAANLNFLIISTQFLFMCLHKLQLPLLLYIVIHEGLMICDSRLARGLSLSAYISTTYCTSVQMCCFYCLAELLNLDMYFYGGLQPYMCRAHNLKGISSLKNSWGAGAPLNSNYLLLLLYCSHQYYMKP